MRKPTAKTELKVLGTMLKRDAGIVGRRLANSAFVLAVFSGAALLVSSIALLLSALHP